jgi:integrase
MRRSKRKTAGGIYAVDTKQGRVWGVDYRDPRTGKRRRRLIGTRELAIRFRSQVQLQAKGFDVPPEDIPFEVAVGRYLEHRDAQNRGERSYRFLKKEWPEAFHGRPVPSITTEEVEEQLNRWMKARAWAPATRNQALNQLSGFFSWCYSRRWIERHPTERGRVPRLPVDNARARWLRLHEVEALLAHAPEWLRLIIHMAVKSGMRLGEIVSLRRSNFVEDESGNAYLVTERTKNGERLHWPLMGELRKAVEESVQRAQFPGNRLFPGPDGGDARTSIDRFFPAVVKAAGLRYGMRYKDGVTFHTLRHTMASLALNAGVPKHVVQKMGNWKTAVIVDRYAHLADETMRDGAAKLDTLLGPGRGSTDGANHTVRPLRHKRVDDTNDVRERCSDRFRYLAGSTC